MKLPNELILANTWARKTKGVRLKSALPLSPKLL
jgi:hypothetical protein